MKLKFKVTKLKEGTYLPIQNSKQSDINVAF